MPSYTYATTPQSKIRVNKKQNGTVGFAVEDICKATGTIRSAKKVFPDMAASINMFGGQAGALESKLEVEMR